MSDYKLIADCYVLPTPAGAYYATSSSKKEPIRRLLILLMIQDHKQSLTIENLQEMLNADNPQDALELLYRAEALGWLQISEEPHAPPEGLLEDIVPGLLAKLAGSSSGKALLADEEGFYLATHGFSHETAEEISALSADLASLHQRHEGLLKNNIGTESSAWAIVNAGGDSHLGFWPMFIGKQRFSLIISGQPAFNQSAYMKLVWTLSTRYTKLD